MITKNNNENNKNNGSPFRLDHVNNNNERLQECMEDPHPHRVYRSAWQMTKSALTMSFSRSAWTDVCPHPYPLFLQECIANGMLHSPHFSVEARGQHHHRCFHFYVLLQPPFPTSYTTTCLQSLYNYISLLKFPFPFFRVFIIFSPGS